MSENNIRVYVGNDAPISANLRSALEDLIEAVESSGIANESEAEVEGFSKPMMRGVQVGLGRPATAPTSEPMEFGCIGRSTDENGKESCWVNW